MSTATFRTLRDDRYLVSIFELLLAPLTSFWGQQVDLKLVERVIFSDVCFVFDSNLPIFMQQVLVCSVSVTKIVCGVNQIGLFDGLTC